MNVKMARTKHRLLQILFCSDLIMDLDLDMDMKQNIILSFWLAIIALVISRCSLIGIDLVHLKKNKNRSK